MAEAKGRKRKGLQINQGFSQKLSLGALSKQFPAPHLQVYHLAADQIILACSSLVDARFEPSEQLAHSSHQAPSPPPVSGLDEKGRVPATHTSAKLFSCAYPHPPSFSGESPAVCTSDARKKVLSPSRSSAMSNLKDRVADRRGLRSQTPNEGVLTFLALVLSIALELKLRPALVPGPQANSARRSESRSTRAWPPIHGHRPRGAWF